MKKHVLLILVVLVVTLSLSACGKFNCKHDDPTQVEILEAKAATCQESGLTEGLRCKLCGVMIIPQAVVSATECTDIVYMQYKAPTCQEKGRSGGKQCNICGKVFVEPQYLSKISCEETDLIVDKKPTQTNDGLGHTECKMCAKTIRQIIIAAGTQGLEYVQNKDGTYTLEGDGDQVRTEIVIPRMYNGKNVTSIGTHALMGNNAKSIIIPNTVKTIQAYAFSHCYSLEKIVIPNGVESIGNYCFRNCESIESIDIPDSVTVIEHAAFWGCTNLRTVNLPSSGIIIGQTAFYKCTSLVSIDLPDDMTVIQSSTFASCSSLRSVTIPSAVTNIQNDAFSGCTALTTIIFEGTVEQWNEIVFGQYWRTHVPATEVICLNGTVILE